MKTKIIHLNINGMTCSGCSSHIEKDMNAKEGVLSSAVNHETGIGEFIIDTNKMDREKLIDAVNNIGDYSVINEAEKKITVVSNLENTTMKDSSNDKNDYDLIIVGGGKCWVGFWRYVCECGLCAFQKFNSGCRNGISCYAF